MRYKKFGSTGKDISVLCLGTWALGGKQFGAVTQEDAVAAVHAMICLLYTSPSPRDLSTSRMPSSA